MIRMSNYFNRFNFCYNKIPNFSEDICLSRAYVGFALALGYVLG